MTPDQVLRELRILRYSGRTGRPVTFRWLARQSGYHFTSLYRAITRGYIAKPMAERLAVALSEHHNAFLGRIGGGFDGRGYRGSGAKRSRRPPNAS